MQKLQVKKKRKTFDAQRTGIDTLRKQYQEAQHKQFELEKKLAVADTTIQNLQRSQLQLKEEAQQRNIQLQQVETDLKRKKNLPLKANEPI